MGALVEVVRGGSLATNCYILVSGGEAVVVDPGWPGVVRVVLDRLRVAGAELRAIVLTHMHFDHTLGVSELAGATGADVVVGRVEYYAALRLAEVRLEGVEEPLFPPLGVDPSTLVSEGDSIRVGDVELRVLEAPGHSPGSIVLVGSRLAFTGDVLFKGSVGRVDLPGSDPHAMEETLSKIAESIPPDHRVYPGHGPSTFMAAELSHNPFLSRLRRSAGRY